MGNEEQNDEVTIAFDVSGTFEQRIEILTEDSQEEFLNKIKEGEYWITLCPPNSEVLSCELGTPVGKIIDTGIGQHTEYTNYELKG